jgi:glycerol-3-phosphate dehydrogenase
MIFLLPWDDYSLIGTTESDDVDDLDALRAREGEVGYLLNEVNRVVPDARLQASDVIATFAGARPLLAFSGSATRASREHRIELDRRGLVSVMGGKYTTFRVMAKQAVDGIVQRFRLRAERCLTDQISLLESAHPIVLSRWQEVTRRIAPELLSRLLSSYGTGAFRILQLVEFEPGLASAVCPHHDVIQAELVYGWQEELACTVSDLLVRRTHIAYSACQGLDLLSTLRDLLKRYGRISEERLDEQCEAYHRFLADGLAFRPALIPAGAPTAIEVSDAE